MPREPEKYKLLGHRNSVNVVNIHPVFPLFASASADATIRLWDYEQGEAEHTLKGHQGIIHGLSFNSNG